MASAGKILITPKGNWDIETEYEVLDLVFHNHISWLSKVPSKGIEPSEANGSTWFKLCESADLAEINNRISAIENQLLSTLSLDDIDLSGYATKSELTNYATKTDLNNVSASVASLDEKATWIHNRTTSLESAVSGLDSRIDGISSSDNINKLNYSGEVKKYYSALPYTCPSAGEVTVYIKDDTSTSGESYLRINKNDKPAAYLTFMGGGMEMASTFPVAQGDVINRNGAAGNIAEGWITFTPYV